MGKYIGSPWGFIRGKIGDAVGGAWKGIDWVRVRVLPTQRGTLENYRLLKDGQLPPSRFSYPQMNIRRAITQVLGYLGRRHKVLWFDKVWQSLVDKRGWTLTATNAFVKRNAATLLSSMDRELEFEEDTNAPDLLQLLVSDGDLESTPILTATYATATGETILTWSADTFENGDETDVCNVIVLKKPILESAGRDGTWYPSLFAYPIIPAPELPAVAATRADTTVTVTLPAGLDPADLTAYLFFRDTEVLIGYSPSGSHEVIAPV